VGVWGNINFKWDAGEKKQEVDKKGFGIFKEVILKKGQKKVLVNPTPQRGEGLLSLRALLKKKTVQTQVGEQGRALSGGTETSEATDTSKLRSSLQKKKKEEERGEEREEGEQGKGKDKLHLAD